MLNVFKWDHTHRILDEIESFFWSIKYAWQRATRGFCDRDAWNLDLFYGKLMGETLEYLAKNHYGYPGVEPFDTDEKWTAALLEASQHFKNAVQEESPDAQKYWEEYQSHLISSTWVTKDSERAFHQEFDDPEAGEAAYEKWKQAELDFTEWQEQEKDKGLAFVIKYWRHLWD